MRRSAKIGIGIIVLLIIILVVYLAYDRSLMPPAPEYKSPPYVPGETWEQYATRFLATSKKPNALEHYLKAYDLVTTKPLNDAYFEVDTINHYGWIHPFPKTEKALLLNQNAIQEVILGAQMKHCELPPEPFGEKAPQWQHYLKSHVLSKLIIMMGKKMERENKYYEAVHYYLDAIQFGKDLAQKEHPLIALIISSGFIRMDTKAILQLISQDKLTGKDYHFMIHELSRIEREQTSFAESLGYERNISYAELYQTSGTPIKFAKLMNRSYFPLEQKKTPNAIIASYIFFNRGRVLHNYSTFFNEMLREFETKSYHEFIQINWKSKAPRDLINRKYLITFYWEPAYTRHMNEISLLHLAQIQAAIQLYHLEKKQWPKELDDLKPYLPTIPADPFTDKPFLWSQDSVGRPFAYSVGPDFVDNSAKLVYDPTNGTTSTGDIFP